MAIIRTTQVPMLAVCGSHQLVCAAFNGWSAVAHMNDTGAPVLISDELALEPPAPLFPDPRVGEQGTYPIAATEAGAGDPLVATIGDGPMASVHHQDMVVDTTGFTLLCVSDATRPAASSGANQALTRCAVQAVRRQDDSRLFYSSQFHPEMPSFGESTSDDAGLGRRWIGAFLREAAKWWTR